MNNTKPLVAVAAGCEKVLWEKDGVLSAIRFVETFTLTEPAPEGMLLPLTLLVSLKAGEYTGKGELSLVMQAPDGARVPVPEKWPLSFCGGETGANVILNLAFSAQKLGLFWVEVLWNGELLTKVPIKLAQEPSPHAPGQPSLQ
jgi:hypothetical protein